MSLQNNAIVSIFDFVSINLINSFWNSKPTLDHGRAQCFMVLEDLESLIWSLSYLIAKNYSGFVFRKRFSRFTRKIYGSESGRKYTIPRLKIRGSRLWISVPSLMTIFFRSDRKIVCFNQTVYFEEPYILLYNPIESQVFINC